jgi:hypothetical protein
LFSSLTLNMALGNVSRTVAMTSIASSFDNQCPLLALTRLCVLALARLYPLDQSIATRSESLPQLR